MNPALYLPPDYVAAMEALIADHACTCRDGGRWAPCSPPRAQPVLYETCAGCNAARRHKDHKAAVGTFCHVNKITLPPDAQAKPKRPGMKDLSAIFGTRAAPAFQRGGKLASSNLLS